MLLLLSTLLFFSHFPIISHSLKHQTLTDLPQCNEKCGELEIPYPFHLNSSCVSLSDAFKLSCRNSSTLLLNVTSESYRVLDFFSDGVLVDFPSSSSSSSSPCRRYNDLNSFTLGKNDHFGVSSENVIGLYDCEDSSLCKPECEALTLPGCGGSNEAPGCCYPLTDHTVWRFGDEFSVFSNSGCRGFSSWAVERAASSGKRGMKLEWAVPRSSAESVCGDDAFVVNATAVKGGVRCKCNEGFNGDGFAGGRGCVRSCIREGTQIYGDKCNIKKHNDKKLLIIVGVLSLSFLAASFAALFCLQKRSGKNPNNEFDTNRNDFHSHNILLQRACWARLFTLAELEAATEGFDANRRIFEGSNGSMYAGILLDGLRVAVHKIRCSNEAEFTQILNDIDVLSSTKHRNLAALIGCCIDAPQTPMIVYEYPINGTLEEHLHRRRETKTAFDWSKRLSVAVEIASALAFLSPSIFHGELKPGSVFLDENLSAKVAGFGFLTTPKRAGHTPFPRSDVCDIGLLLLEMIAGPNKAMDLPAMALMKMRNGKLEEIVDPVLYYHELQSSRCEQIENVADLAARCLLFGGGGDGKLGMSDVARELGQIASVDAGTSKRGPDETFSNSSLLQMISMSPDSIYLP